MKIHTNNYKNEISTLGKQLTSKITYGNIELGEDDLNSITPSFKSSILKSAMKQLDIDSNVDIPIGTEINYQFGLLVGNTYEYLDFGNYIVYSSEKQEDLNSYKIIAYDKMLYAMKDYEDMNITYPITIRDYINAICNHLGLTFANASDTFANYDKTIIHELYLNADGDSIGYTFRDVLDELAQVTASTICINKNDELEIRYITETNDSIDEEYFNSINVNFGEKYGPINSIVLARVESDKVYLKDDESIAQNGLCEIMINDNQIMNGDDRNTYLLDILTQLDGLEYYLNDFSSTGITYYDICDRYSVIIGENTYSCVMFNDEINVTQGLQELVYTDKPDESETDYKKADKEDRKINQTRIEVDKHNQQISTLISQVGDRGDKQTSLTQDVDSLTAQVENLPSIITENSGYGSVTLQNLANSKIALLRVHPTNNVDIIRNVASTHLKVRIGNKVGHRGLKFTQEEEIEYKLPTNLYFYSNSIYDEFVIDGVNERMYVTHNVGFVNGEKVALDNPIIEEFTYQDIIVEEGDLTITYSDYPTAYIYLKAMIKNDFTKMLATKLELKSTIEQTAQAIGLSVEEFNEGEKVSGATILAQINNDESEVKIEADKINLNGVVTANEKFKINLDGTMEANGGVFKGTINTNDDCIVGNNLVVGVNQAYDSNAKSIHLTDKTDISCYYDLINNIADLIFTSGKFTFWDMIKEEDGEDVENWESIKLVQFARDWVESFRKVYCWQSLSVRGDLNVSGTKNRVVTIDDGTQVKLNAYETATPYFADIGSASTNKDGECIIKIEEVFKQTIELENYKVFLQEMGEGKLWVEKHEDYFIVKGTPNLEFDYEIKAIQKGYANTRLEKYERSDK